MSAPTVDKRVYGTLESGTPVHQYTLANGRGVSARILDYGGVITEINVPDRKGEMRNVVLGFGNLEAYTTTATMNAVVGRFANRLKKGFDLDGTHYPLVQDAHGLTLHGGPSRYGSRLWGVRPFPHAQDAGVVLSLVSPDGDQGFPGELRIEVTYRLTGNDEFRIDFEAVADRSTVVNLTNHLYLNLAGNGSGSVYGHQLQVLADEFTPTDADQVPTGVLAPVAGTALDFRELRAIGSRIASSEPQMLMARGYDHNYVLRRPAGGAPPLAARLYDPASGRMMELRTTEPGVQVYSANFMTGSLVSATGNTIRQGDGLALETQHFPNSPNVPQFPSTALRAGDFFRSTSVFRFSTDAA